MKFSITIGKFCEKICLKLKKISKLSPYPLTSQKVYQKNIKKINKVGLE